jgi:hypothetical protein
MSYDDYGTAPEMWSERALVSLSMENGNTVHFTTITDTVDLDLGDKDFDTVSPVSGGRLIKFTPEGDSTVTLDLYPIAAGNDWGTDGEEAAGFYDLLHTRDKDYDPQDESEAVTFQEITTQLNRQRFRLTLLWTNDTSLSDATVELTSGDYAGLRVSLCGYFTKVAPSFTDDEFKVSVTMKIPPFKKNGDSNIQISSTDKSSVTNLTALDSFTSTDNFYES